jgi:inner membrane protein
MLARKRLHPVQYLFTGAALVLFFVLVLSLAEHTGFLPAYVLAALATSGLVAAYVRRALGSFGWGGVMLGVLLILYALLYLILRLEDYALLAGALAAFAMLGTAMFLTLGVDWSGTMQPTEDTSS